MLKPEVLKPDIDFFFRDPLQRILFNFPDTEENDQVCKKNKQKNGSIFYKYFL